VTLDNDDPAEPRLDDLLVKSSYMGYVSGLRCAIVNAPPEIALPALTRLAAVHGIALCWQKFNEAYVYGLVTTEGTRDAGEIARRFPSGKGTPTMGTWTASKLLVN
jgi:hypothetical protein